MRTGEFISLFGGMAAAWSLAAHAQESATMRASEATRGTLPQIEMPRVKPVDRTPPNLRLSDDLIDLMKDFSLSERPGYRWCLGDTTAPVDALRRALRAMVKSLCPAAVVQTWPRPPCAPTR